MSGRRSILAIVAVEAEARALEGSGWEVVVAGIGRTNAAAAATQAILERGPFAAVLSVGVAGSLPGSGLSIGDLVVASESVYFEEGIETPSGFLDSAGLGFPLGPFNGNRVPADPRLLGQLEGFGRVAPIATVATCSGIDRLAALVASRTGAAAEAMEGAAVMHAATRLGVPAAEVRSISNTTGDRPRQRWDLAAALGSLRSICGAIAERLDR